MFTKNKDIFILISRLIIGGIFVVSGWMKVSAMTQTIGFFHTLGLPASLAYLVGYAELIAGLLVVFGLFIERSALILAIIMVVAVYFTRGGGLQMYGFPLTMLAGLLLIIVSGPGAYILRSKKKTEAVIK